MPVVYTNHITRARKIVKRSMVESLNAAAKAHVVYSQLIVPIDTGALSKSIQVVEEATEARPQAIVQAGGGEVNYAEFVEYGTVKMAAQPFFTPGMELGRQRIVEEGYRGTAELRRGSGRV